MSAHAGFGAGRVRFVQIGTQDRGRIRAEVDDMLAYLEEIAMPVREAGS
jgi:hypothetical protein